MRESRCDNAPIWVELYSAMADFSAILSREFKESLDNRHEKHREMRR